VFCDAVENTFTTITQCWAIDLNNGAKNLAFHIANHNCPTHIFNATIKVNLFLYKDIFLASIMQMKGQCFVAIEHVYHQIGEAIPKF
jgi:hypothetical protein